MEKIREFLKQFGVLVLVGVVGCGVLIYGLWGQIIPEKSVVEIIKADGVSENGEVVEVVVDVAGSVEKPGLYKLRSGSRIGDCLVMAGGLSASADREWVSKTINLAEIVKDGRKIYIPSKNVSNPQIPSSNLQTNSNNQSSKLININTASLAELDSLPEIGEARAKTILDNRPYSKTDDLVSKAKIPASVYEKIKDQVSVY